MKKNSNGNAIWGMLRISLGFIFLWAFFDKLFGLGFATTPEKSWLTGSSPTTGFLKFGTHGPFKEFYQSLAGNPLVDWLFMVGLLGIGVALILGICVRLASYFGALMVVLMYLALFPPENNPILDEHIIYALLFLSFNFYGADSVFSLKNAWSKTSLVKHFPILQ